MIVRKAIVALLASGIVLSATACNTVKGAGQDVESASDATKAAINK